MFGSLGVPELLIILLIVLIMFGASKLPQLGKGLGQGLRNFKDSVKGDEPPADKKPRKGRIPGHAGLSGGEPRPRAVSEAPRRLESGT